MSTTADLDQIRFEAGTRIERGWETLVIPKIRPERRGLGHAILDRTLEAYSEGDRYYHTEMHIDDCLRKLDPYKDREDFINLWLATLWHDVVYDTHALDNEEQSAIAAETYILETGVGYAHDVARLIRSTKTHQPEEHEDEQLLCAIDMSILAEPPEVYDAYAAAIRQEYAWVQPPERFNEGRRQILEGFGQVFFHPDFVHLEDQAQANMARELDTL